MWVVPIPAGSTYVSVSLMGGDTVSGGTATTVTYCTSFVGGNCPLADHSSHYLTYTTPPFLVVYAPIAVLGGGTTTLPTLALTLAATGPSLTPVKLALSEYTVLSSATLATGNPVAASFKGWPSDPSQPAGTPPTFPPAILSTTWIV